MNQPELFIIGDNVPSERQLVSVKELGAWLDLTSRRCQQLVRQGVFPRTGRRGHYDLAVCLREYIRYLRHLVITSQPYRVGTLRRLKREAAP